MNRLLFGIVLLNIIPLMANGQSPSRKTPHPVEQQLIQLERAWSQADFRQDVQTIKRLVAEEWIGTTSRGKILNRSRMLDEVVAVKADGDSTISDTRVRMYGKTAIVTGLLTTNNPPSTGQPILKRFTDVWLNTKAGWRCIASHGSYVK
jgi:ketosteroid isomerase-like protein